jgi:hypothetical protein
MLKLFRQLALRCLAFSLLAIALTFSNLAFSNPLLAQVTPSSDGPNPASTELKSTEKARTTVSPDKKLDVMESEKDTTGEQTTKLKSSEPQDEYDMNAIHDFDQELYGD